MLDKDNLLMSLGPPDANMGSRDSSANTSQIYCLVVWSISQACPIELCLASGCAPLKLAAEFIVQYLVHPFLGANLRLDSSCVAAPLHSLL